jgi:phenylalanyl-tRNA synthetase alpha chain
MSGTRGPVPVLQKEGDLDITQQVLNALDKSETFKSSEAFPNLPTAQLKAALDRLASRSMVEYATVTVEQVVLEKEGQTIAEQGSHEYKVWKAVSSAGKVAIKELATIVGDAAKFGQGTAMKVIYSRQYA